MQFHFLLLYIFFVGDMTPGMLTHLCRPVAFTYMLTYHIRTHVPHMHLRLFLSLNHHLLLDLDYLSLSLSLSQSHNSSSFSCCLILIKIPSQSLVLLPDLTMSFQFTRIIYACSIFLLGHDLQWVVVVSKTWSLKQHSIESIACESHIQLQLLKKKNF